jgi:hypothetical protein
VKKFLIFAFITGALVGLFYFVGMVLPRTNTTSCRALYKSPPDKVYAVLADIESWPQWVPWLSRVEPLPEEDRHPVWNLIDRENRPMKLEIGSAEEPLKMGATFQVEGARGNFRYEIKWFGEGCILRITEQRDHRSPWRRAARLFQDQDADKLAFLVALGGRLGETVTAEKL